MSLSPRRQLLRSCFRGGLRKLGRRAGFAAGLRWWRQRRVRAGCSGALHWSGRRFAATAFRCSGLWPVANSLRGLRPLRSNSRDESVLEARCARGHKPCAPQRPRGAPRHSPPEPAFAPAELAHGAQCIRAAISKRQTSNVKRQTANGERRTANGERRTANGTRVPEAGSRNSASAIRHPPSATRHFALGPRHPGWIRGKRCPLSAHSVAARSADPRSARAARFVN